MISVMALIRTATDLSEPLVKETLAASGQARADGEGIVGRVFNRVTDSTQRGFEYARPTLQLDAIAQFFCRDISSGMSGAASGGLNLSMGVPGHIIEEMHPLLCLQNTVISAPTSGRMLKRMSTLRKRPDVSTEEFQKQWFDLHAVLVKRLSGIAGYRQNLVLDGPRDTSGAMLVDGMVELWFPDATAIETAFRSDVGVTTMTHAKEFIAEIATFLVDPIHVSGVF